MRSFSEPSRQTPAILIPFCGGETLDHIAVDERARSAACRRSQMFFTWRRSMAEFSSQPITAGPGSRSLTINRPHRSARSQFRFQIRPLFTSAAAKDCIALIFPWVTAFTNRPMPAKHGRISDYATANRSRSWRWIQKIRRNSSSRSLDIRTDRTRSAAFIDRSMAGRRSKTFCIAMKTSVQATCRSIQLTRTSFTQRFGNRAKRRGKTAYSMAMAAAFSNQLMAAKRGDS